MAASNKNNSDKHDAALLTFLSSMFFCLILLTTPIEADRRDIPRLSDNLARAAEGLESAVVNGGPDEMRDAIAVLLQNYRAMEKGVEVAYKAAGGGEHNEEVAKQKAEKYYGLVDRIWKDGVGGKEAKNIKAADLARGAGEIGREMRRLSRNLDFSKVDAVDRILAHAEAILIMGEDLDLVAFGGPQQHRRRGDENSSEENSKEGQK